MRTSELFRVRNDTPDGGEQRLELDRFDIELVAPRGNSLLALAVQRKRGHADDRDVTSLRIVLEEPHRFPSGLRPGARSMPTCSPSGCPQPREPRNRQPAQGAS